MIGHRGASGYIPEHTLVAYFNAIQQGANYVDPRPRHDEESHIGDVQALELYKFVEREKPRSCLEDSATPMVRQALTSRRPSMKSAATSIRWT